MIKLNAFIKGLILFVRPHAWLGWLRHPFLMASNTLSLSKWIATEGQKALFNDFYTPTRNYDKRLSLFQFVLDHAQLGQEAIDYLEFGVCEAASFKWWLSHTHHAESRYYGFDTFEGLPEDWGTYNKGDMSAGLPTIDDTRAVFYKGLFQETMKPFLSNVNLNNGKRKVIHLDADLFSSTLFALTSLAPFLKKGDILFFDEFNVPNHEFFAFKMFTDSFYVKTRVLGAVNNYYQVAMIIE